MRTYELALACGLSVVAAACGNKPDPRVIPGGGIGDGDIDDLVNVYVIDNDTYAPIADATVEIGTTDQTTDETGLVIFQNVSGAQTITVSASGYRGTVWEGANGANVTIPVTKLGTATPQQATLSGSIASWDSVTVAQGHLKAAAILYSQDDNIDDSENNITTPNNGNICGVTGTTCDWTVATRTGTVTLFAAIIDRDTKGTVTTDDDTTSIIGWATAPSVQVNSGVAQSGLELTMVDAGDLQTVTIDLGTPPAALTTTQAVIGVELANNEVVQLPLYAQTDTTSMLAPLPSVFAVGATYRLTAVAETTDDATGPQSIDIERGLTTTSLAATRWLEPPTNVVASRTSASFDAVATAKAHSIQWSDSTGILVEITLFDNTVTTATVPDLVALPATGALSVKPQGIGADFDIHDFSLEDDKDLLWGVSTQPTTVQ